MASYPTDSDRWSCEWSNVWYAFGFFSATVAIYRRDLPGTPSQIARSSEDVTMLSLEDNRTRKRNTPGDHSMRRTIQDLVSSIDPNVKIEPEVEDVCSIVLIPKLS